MPICPSAGLGGGHVQTGKEACPLLVPSAGHVRWIGSRTVWHAVTIQHPGPRGDKLGGEVTPSRRLVAWPITPIQ